MRPGRTKGFTLIEMLVTIAIAAILAALATVGLLYGTGRARLNNGVYSVSSFATIAQMRARARGTFEYLVFFQKGSKFGAYLVERQDALTDWTTVSALDPGATDGNTVVDKIDLSNAGGYDFYPINSTPFGATLPAPFSAIGLTAAAGSGSLSTGCTFCIASADGGTIGVIQFGPDGLATDISGANVSGGAVALATTHPGEAPNPKVVVISTPGGVIKVF